MWLRLYQSASIWLVRGLSRSPTHRSIDPQVQIGLRPIASRIAAAMTDGESCEHGAADGSSSKGLAEGRGLQSTAVPRTQAPCCALMDPAATEVSSKRRLEKDSDSATWIDLEEPTTKKKRWSSAAWTSTSRPRTNWPRSNLRAGSTNSDGALYMTVSVLCGVADGDPTTSPVGFVLSDNRLVTFATRRPSRCARSSSMCAVSRTLRAMRRRSCPPARRDHRPARRRARGSAAPRSSRFRAHLPSQHGRAANSRRLG